MSSSSSGQDTDLEGQGGVILKKRRKKSKQRDKRVIDFTLSLLFLFAKQREAQARRAFGQRVAA